MSSYQIDLTPGWHARIAILLNITPDHLDRHGSMANYAAIKSRIFAGPGTGDTAIIGVDDDHCRATFPALEKEKSGDRKGVAEGKKVSERVELGGVRI